MKQLSVEQTTFYYTTLCYDAKDAPLLFYPNLTPIHRHISRAEQLSFRGKPITYEWLCHRSLMTAALSDNENRNHLKYQQFKRHLLYIMRAAKRMEYYELCANLRDAIDAMNNAFNKYLLQIKPVTKNETRKRRANLVAQSD